MVEITGAVPLQIGQFYCGREMFDFTISRPLHIDFEGREML